MSIPKIVLIDDDIKYVFLLQARLGEHFLSGINLEVITERNFYKEYFYEPKNIDLLIIDEKFYNQDMQKHNIKKILLLIENENIEHGNIGNVIRIYKYSNMRDIFNIINSRNIGLFHVNQSQNITQIILVTSAAGGIGKTTIALGLSMALERDYKKVLYVDAESFQTFYYLMEAPEFLDGNELVELTNNDEICEYLTNHICDKEISYLPAFKNPILSVGLSFGLYKSFIESAKKSGEYDYIVIDSDSAFNEEKVELIGCADKVLFITDQSKKGCYSTNQIIKHISEVNDGKYLFICNRFVRTAKNQKHETEADYSISEFVEFYSDGEVELKTLHLLSGLHRISFLLQ